MCVMHLKYNLISYLFLGRAFFPADACSPPFFSSSLLLLFHPLEPIFFLPLADRLLPKEDEGASFFRLFCRTGAEQTMENFKNEFEF